MAKTISFSPRQITKRLLSILKERDRSVLEKRFGLGKEPKRMTLESIGQGYGITRERVRQIENFSLDAIRKSVSFKELQKHLEELKVAVLALGGIITEQDLLNHFSNNESSQNHISLLLVLGSDFYREKENDMFRHRWFVDKNIAEGVQKALIDLHESLTNQDVISDEKFISMFSKKLKSYASGYDDEAVIRRWLSLAKQIDKNSLNEWGRADSPNIKTRGMKDYAFLIIRRHGNPMHFSEVAKAITDTFGKKAHIATCHNELIKDVRFVLVGRGLYALKEWGYVSGVVRDVIKEVLEKNGPLKRDVVMEKVLTERYVKPNTILVNLQNSKYFKKDDKGRYFLI